MSESVSIHEMNENNNDIQIAIDTTSNMDENDGNKTTKVLKQLSPISGKSNIRAKIRELEQKLFHFKNEVEKTNTEIKKVHNMLDPLRISMKKYTDSREQEIRNTLENVTKKANEQFGDAGGELNNLKNENDNLKKTINDMKSDMARMAETIKQLQGQIFGDYEENN